MPEDFKINVKIKPAVLWTSEGSATSMKTILNYMLQKRLNV